ncbi:MAG: ferrous iron transporter B [Myxococcota bacterium]|nr:ferrous iron transporter B [Myxococcota bacterium]
MSEIARPEQKGEPLRIGLLGSPNSGKTTLFNALTGLRAKVGNYPGVTVEKREGIARLQDRSAHLIDLPGTYSLNAMSPDEAVVGDALEGRIEDLDPPNALLVVADACSLERSLLLIGQILRLRKPTCLALTMMDELEARGGSIDLPRLEAALGIPVIPVVGHRGKGIRALRERLKEPRNWSAPPVDPPETANERAEWADSILAACLRERPSHHAISEKIDRVILHPVWGSLLFLLVMLTFFQLIFAWAQPAMDVIDAGIGFASETIRQNLGESLLAAFLADGLVAGVGSVLIFLPQIILLFSLLYLLEDLGYMARAAFVVDRAMARVGLEGRAFVAMLSSFACAVPGIMATRSIPSPRDRLVTILVAPLMTCSARLPVYALLIAAFVPDTEVVGPIGLQGLVLFGLYLAAPVAALSIASILRRTLLIGSSLPFSLELPSYRLPGLRLWLSQIWGSTSAFLRRAGGIILLVSILLWVLLTFPRATPPEDLSPDRVATYALEHSAAGQIGHFIEPAIAPLGFDWKIGVGLVASLAAREVIVATLGQIYAASAPGVPLREAIRNDVDPQTGQRIFTPPTVAALLVFFIFALLCTSTLAIMVRETNSWRWPAFAFLYMLALAYGFSWIAHTVTAAIIRT